MGFVRGTFAVIAGLMIGSMVNMGLIMLSGKVIPAPTGADVTTLEGLTASMHRFEPKHFLFPFLAHALGTLIGAAVAAKISGGRKFLCPMIVGGFFLIGGIANVAMLPAPLWFEVTDLLLAYVPMAVIGRRLVVRNAK